MPGPSPLHSTAGSAALGLRRRPIDTTICHMTVFLVIYLSVCFLFLLFLFLFLFFYHILSMICNLAQCCSVIHMISLLRIICSKLNYISVQLVSVTRHMYTNFKLPPRFCIRVVTVGLTLAILFVVGA